MRVINKCLSVLAVLFLLAACSSSSPEKTAKKFIAESYSGNADAVIAMIYMPDERKEKPGEKEIVSGKVKASVAKQKQYAEERGGIAEITAEPARFDPEDNKRANVRVKIRFKLGDSRQDYVRLIDTGTGWKVRL